MINEKTKELLKIVWDYMVIETPIEKSDLIIGCGCLNLKIPVRCSKLIKQGYADKVIFTGGLGKLTQNEFKKSEAEIFKQIAIENGINENSIFVENKSTNTGDNFKFTKKIMEENNINANKIIIVHNNLSRRRTLNAAKVVFPDKKLSITSPKLTFEESIENLNSKTDMQAKNIISVMVGDIQRIIIFPQFGWQVKDIVPDKVIQAYYELKAMGYDDYIFSKEQIQSLIDKSGTIECEELNYFN